MGRPKTSADILHLTGGYRDDRHAGRGNRPAFSGEPRPLSMLSPEGAQIWQEFVPDLIKTRIVCAIDSLALTMLCSLIEHYRRAAAEFVKLGPGTHPGRRAGATMTTLATLIANQAAKFGLDPKAREALLVPPGEEPIDPIERRFFSRVDSRKRHNPAAAAPAVTDSN